MGISQSNTMRQQKPHATHCHLIDKSVESGPVVWEATAGQKTCQYLMSLNAIAAEPIMINTDSQRVQKIHLLVVHQ